jgi:hypothetical protein
MTDIEKIKGQTPIEIDGMHEGSQEVVIKTKEGGKLVLSDPGDYSTVEIVQVDGDPLDLLGLPLEMAEEVSNVEPGPTDEQLRNDDSFTWTFIKFATVAGYVTLRWYGSSNGYYAEQPSVGYTGPDVGPHARATWG